MRRIAQPEVDRLKRSVEQRDGWAGLVLAIISVALVVSGIRHVTGVSTTDGNSASEVQLVKAFSSGGLHYSNPAAMPDASVLNDPARAAAAFEKFQRRDRRSNKLVYKVDTGACTPCPT